MPAASHLPACCSAPRALWPFARHLPGVQLHSCHFDPAALSAEAYQQAAIAAPASVLRAAAKRQTEFLAGRLCARAALAGHGRQALAEDREEDGAPRWPTGLCGSITHSKGLAAAVVGTRQDWQGLGLDAEAVLDPARAQHLVGQILTADEQQRLAGLDDSEQAWLISLTFCSKESLFKALYPLVRQRFYFQDAELLDCQPDGDLQLRLLRDLGPQWPAGSLLHGQHAALGSHLLSLVSIANPG
ncbi:4'-phosphopantetheinyl transferase family protein [Pseudomonas sp. N040]|uniref:4'-phosphopantetheinyl transferase family protein n=1 Tax=Pseudomonas sp. N040 TaxID=2785325 RepID=UPI0018A2F4C7|nr:4'-phosphopantetheinyl transferase superfamily protein [Pseudomonas sp. N040]MBF7731266.1 4'-phosphopantetheinyl transferase superfamily protein [Pseudomonas sp. N040]MBW7014909.1 4'-phosphopantetheinyl transferase superfamily protein [Pseudomonas sp. N040]